MSYVVSVDQGLRSTGLTTFLNDELLTFKIIKTEKTKTSTYEEDIHNIWLQLRTVLTFSKFDIVFEGLSLGSISSKKDVIYGLHWYLRTRTKQSFYNANINVIPVSEWRNSFTTKDERKSAKINYEKDHLKHVVVNKIDKNIILKFEDYLEKNNLHKNCLFDLCDSYALGRYFINRRKNESEKS